MYSGEHSRTVRIGLTPRTLGAIGASLVAFVLLILLAAPLGFVSLNSSVHQAPMSLTTHASPSSSFPTPIQHVIEIVMENQGTSAIIGSSGQPYENSLATTYAWGGTSYFAMCHPSAPNYLALTSGQTLQCGTDAYNTYGVNNIGNLLQTNSLSWVVYEESMPSPCATSGGGGTYAVKHNPIAYYADIASVCASHDLPISNLVTSFPFSTTPAAWTFIAPNQLNDGHDTGAAYGDQWLSTFIPKLISQSWFSSTVIFIVYDECANTGNCQTGPGGGPVALIAVSPYSIGIGAISSTNSHLNLLSTQEYLLGLPCTGSGGDCGAAPLNTLFNFGSGSSPTATASVSPSSGPAPLAVQFTGGASGGSSPYSYSWSFADGGSSTQQSPSHTYTTAGNYTAMLTVTDSASKHGSASVLVSVSPASQPLAATASANTTSGPAPLAVQFAGSASGGTPPYMYGWSFGDGGSSSIQSPWHVYAGAGNFSAILTVSDLAGGQATSSVLVTVHSASSNLSAKATANTTSGPAPLGVQFTGKSSGGVSPYTFNWTFGDGGISSRNSPAHTYRTSGTYDAVLRVTDSSSHSAFASLIITVGSAYPPLNATALANTTEGTAPLAVQFGSQVTGGAPPLAYLWTFGDGTRSRAASPAHTFSSPGGYLVRLNVSDQLGHSVVSNLLITASAFVEPLTGTLVSNATEAGVSTPVGFTAVVVGGSLPYEFLWNFGDGSSAAGGAGVSHVYSQQGEFDVVVAVNDSASRTWSANTTVQIIKPVSVALSASPTVANPGQPVRISASESGGLGGDSYSWTLNGAPYGGNVSSFLWMPSAAGSYAFNVTVRDPTGITVSGSLTISVVVPAGAESPPVPWYSLGVEMLAGAAAIIATLFIATSCIVMAREMPTGRSTARALSRGSRSASR